MKLKHRLVSFTIVFMLVLVSLNPSKASAATGIDLSYWYTDSSDIYYWDTSTIKTFTGTNVTNSLLSTTKINEYVSLGFSSWNSATGLSRNIVASQSQANLAIGGISSSDASSIGIPANVAGVTLYSGTFAINGYYNNSTKYIYKISSPTNLYLVNSSATSSFTETTWKKVVVHEMGHAFGYTGHYNSGNIMQEYIENVTSTTPSTNEKNHIGQVY